jgi:hypothetical protein
MVIFVINFQNIATHIILICSYILKRKTKYFKCFTDDRKGDDEEGEESQLDEDDQNKES